MSQPMRRFPLVFLFLFLFNFKSLFAQEQETGAVVGIEETPATPPAVNPERLFRDVKIGARAQSKLGGPEASLETQISGPLFAIPMLSQAIRPEDAEVKLGRFYIDVRSVTGTALYSDNINF
jgi:hypothetical protein